MDETLKPCPFCGGSWVITHRPANGSQPYISCKECNASGPLTAGMTEAQWRAAWNTRADTAPTPKSDEVEAVARAIKSASCPGREGPFGGYDYGHNEAFYGPAPEGGRYVIRDYRDPSSPDWGAWLHQTNDRDEHEAKFAKMTDDHVAQAAIAALDAARGNAEPVAWMYSNGNRSHVHAARLKSSGAFYYGDGWTETPLYKLEGFR